MTAVTPIGWDRRYSQSATATSSGPSPRAPRGANGVATGAPAASPKAPRTSPSSGTLSGAGGLTTRPLGASPLPPRLASPKVPRPSVAAPLAPKTSPQTPRNASIPPPPVFSPLPNTWLSDKLSDPKVHGSLLLYNRGLPGSASDGDNREVREGASPKVSLVRHDGAGGEVLVRAYSFQGGPGGSASAGRHAENAQTEGGGQQAQTAADEHCVEDGGALVIANTLRRNYQLGNRSESTTRYRNGYLADVAVTGEDLADRIGLPSRAPAFTAYVAASRKLQQLTLEDLTRQLQENAIWPSKFESLKQRLQSRGIASGGHEASKKLPRLPAEGGGSSGSPTSVLERTRYKLARLQPHLIQFYRFCRQMLLDLLFLSALKDGDSTEAQVTSSQGLPFNGFALPWAAEFVPTSSSLGAMVSGVSRASGDCNGGASLRRQQLAAKWLDLCVVAAGAGKDFAPGDRAQAQAQAKREAVGLKGAWDAEKSDALFEVLSRVLLALRMDEILANVVTGTVDEEEEAAASAAASGKRAEDELVKRWRRRASDGSGTRGALVLSVKLSGTDASRWVLRMAGGVDAHVRRVAAGVIDRILWDVETGRLQNELEKECARLDSNPRPGGISGARSLGEISTILSLPDPLSSRLPRSPLSLSSSESDSSGSDGEDEGKGGRVGGKTPSSIPASSSDVLISRVAGALIASLCAAAALPVGANVTTGAGDGSKASAGGSISSGNISGGGLSPENRSLSLPTGVDPRKLLPASASTSSPRSSTSAGSTASSGSNAGPAQGGTTAEGEDG
ncbi:unnamed protein product [Closterium sp. Yama58-4]|nr:unnamed protein product [Closterium sp. Yama58-4]